MSAQLPTVVYTIGHSTRAIDEFIEILQTYGIRRVVDVRSIARSRHNPQFNEEELRQSLGVSDISYTHLKALGGLRHTTKGSVNQAWRNASFRGYADYMQTLEFNDGIDVLIELAKESPVAIMCAEAVPWRCHRSLIGDALLVRGIEVEDILSASSHRPHHLTPWAKVDGLDITYPATS